MAFMDGTAWKERFLSKSRKKIKQAGQLLMALAVGGCAFLPGNTSFAGDCYYFNNPTSNNLITFDENGNLSSSTSTRASNPVRSTSDGLEVITGYDLRGNGASNNKLTINGGTYHTVMGASSTSSNTNNNIITFNNGKANDIIGAYNATSGETTGNTVNVNGGEVYLITNSNIVNINGGTTNSIYADVVNINGGTISGASYVGSNYTDGELNIYNNPDLSGAVLAGTAKTGDNTYRSTLNVHTSNISAANISAFKNINFYLPSTISNGNTVLTLTKGQTILRGSTIRAGVEGNANLSTGDTVTLIKNENGIMTDNTTAYGTLSEGVSLDYDLTVEQADNTSIVARVGNVAPGAGANTAGSTSSSSSSAGTASTGSTSSSSPLKAQTAILPTPMLSSSVLALQGTDRLLEWLPPDDFGMEEESSSTEEKESEEVGKATSSGDFSIFANAGFTNLRTKTGSNSYIDSHSGGFDIGAARTLENSRGKLVFAPIIDYGTGSYDSYVNGMHGSGKTKYWAGGIIARQMNHNGFYYEASIRAGRTSVDFASNDFKQGTTPVHESYDVSAPVYAGHIRLGRLYQIDRSSQLHLYGIYAHNHQNGMTAQLATGETYRFGSVDSGRLRIGARLSWMKKKTQKFYSGIAYQYEFSNSASGTYRGYSTESSNLRGSSGMIELGWQVKPTENSPWMVDVGAVGWIGHQKGFSIQAKIKKAF